MKDENSINGEDTGAPKLLRLEENYPVKQAQDRLAKSRQKESARKEQDMENLQVWLKALV